MKYRFLKKKLEIYYNNSPQLTECATGPKCVVVVVIPYLLKSPTSVQRDRSI